jgi:hypothetical protein
MKLIYQWNKFTNKLTFTKIGLLIPPFYVNISIMRLIDGESFGWVKGSIIQNRIVSSFALMSFLFLLVLYIYMCKSQLKNIPKYRILGFLLFWFTSFYLHTSYFDYGTGLIGVFGSYFVCAAFQMSILLDLDLKM